MSGSLESIKEHLEIKQHLRKYFYFKQNSSGAKIDPSNEKDYSIGDVIYTQKRNRDYN